MNLITHWTSLANTTNGYCYFIEYFNFPDLKVCLSLFCIQTCQLFFNFNGIFFNCIHLWFVFNANFSFLMISEISGLPKKIPDLGPDIRILHIAYRYSTLKWGRVYNLSFYFLFETYQIFRFWSFCVIFCDFCKNHCILHKNYDTDPNE